MTRKIFPLIPLLTLCLGQTIPTSQLPLPDDLSTSANSTATAGPSCPCASATDTPSPSPYTDPALALTLPSCGHANAGAVPERNPIPCYDPPGTFTSSTPAVAIYRVTDPQISSNLPNCEIVVKVTAVHPYLEDRPIPCYFEGDLEAGLYHPGPGIQLAPPEPYVPLGAEENASAGAGDAGLRKRQIAADVAEQYNNFVENPEAAGEDFYAVYAAPSGDRQGRKLDAYNERGSFPEYWMGVRQLDIGSNERVAANRALGYRGDARAASLGNVPNQVDLAALQQAAVEVEVAPGTEELMRVSGGQFMDGQGASRNGQLTEAEVGPVVAGLGPVVPQQGMRLSKRFLAHAHGPLSEEHLKGPFRADWTVEEFMPPPGARITGEGMEGSTARFIYGYHDIEAYIPHPEPTWPPAEYVPEPENGSENIVAYEDVDASTGELFRDTVETPVVTQQAPIVVQDPVEIAQDSLDFSRETTNEIDELTDLLFQHSIDTIRPPLLPPIVNEDAGYVDKLANDVGLEFQDVLRTVAQGQLNQQAAILNPPAEGEAVVAEPSLQPQDFASWVVPHATAQVVGIATPDEEAVARVAGIGGHAYGATIPEVNKLAAERLENVDISGPEIPQNIQQLVDPVVAELQTEAA